MARDKVFSGAQRAGLGRSHGHHPRPVKKKIAAHTHTGLSSASAPSFAVSVRHSAAASDDLPPDFLVSSGKVALYFLPADRRTT